MGKIMSKIMIDSVGFETRAAIVAAGRLQYFEVERTNRLSLTGNVYKGKVIRVLPSLNAAFLNTGEAREAFLPLTDVADDSLYGEDAAEEKKDGKRHLSRRLKLKPGDQVLVQVVKDAIGTKGPKITANNISIAGYLLVLLPQQQRRGVSRRITEHSERDRLLKIAASDIPESFGFIIRTSALGCREKTLRLEIHRLLSTWEEISTGFKKKNGPVRLHSETDLSGRILRDRYAPEVEEILVDSIPLLKSCRRTLALFGADARKVHLHQGKTPLFTHTGVEEGINKILSRKVALGGGGYIIIEETEALCAVDVNSGRISGEDYRSMVLRTNLLAAEEIAWQLRLRNLGGLIVVDFIDMDRPQDRKQVQEVFEKALEPDKARIKVLRFSKFGLVEMTRQRMRESLRDYLADDCPVCAGRGVVTSDETVAAQLRRSLQVEFKPIRGLLGLYSRKKINLKVSPHFGEYLTKNFNLIFPERIYKNRINLISDTSLPSDQFKIIVDAT